MKEKVKSQGLAAGARVVRSVAAGMLAAAMAAGCVAPAVAFAEAGSVTVNAIEGNEANVYSIYQVFKADIDENDVATHIAWNARAKTPALQFFDANGYNEWLASKGYAAAGAHDNAQNAAEFAAEMIASSPDAAGTSTTPATKDAASFASKFAQALVAADVHADSAQVGSPYTNDEGYYLIVTDPASLQENEAGTAPVWFALGGSSKTITEKSALPTVDKKVKGVGDADWSNATDAFYFQDIDYKLTGTMPSNVKTFSVYHYKFTDTLSGLDLQNGDTSSVKVTVGNTDVTGQLAGQAGSIEYKDGKLTVDIDDVLSIGPDITKDTEVVVTYKAHVIAEPSGTAANGGENKVYLTYTNDPVTNPDGETTEKKTRTFSYKATIVKVDKSNEEKLAGAKFTVQLASYDSDPSLEGSYVQADGSLGSAACEFETSSEGVLEVPGLDAGTYTIKETKAPEGYLLQDADITLVVTSTIDGVKGELTSLKASVSGGEAKSSEGEEYTRLVNVDAASGLIEVLAADNRSFRLAETGLEGLGAYLAIAAALAACGIAGIVVVRRRDDKADRS